jgi:hypothetical protein
MENENVQRLVQLREYAVGQYKALLDDANNPIAVVKQRDVAIALETVIRSIEDLLGDNVTIQ